MVVRPRVVQLLRALAQRRALTFAAVAALALLTALVAAGRLHGLDRYAVAHWMPWLSPRHHALLELKPLLIPAREGPAAARAIDAWTYPASVLASAVIVALCAYRTRRRLLVALWVAANTVEVVGKLAVTKPALYTTHHVHVAGFDHSYPSGHTIRGALVAAAVASAWPRVAPFAWAWFATVPFALVALGYHTPTDVIGGLLVAVVVVAPLVRARERDLDRRRLQDRGRSRVAAAPDPDR